MNDGPKFIIVEEFPDGAIDVMMKIVWVGDDDSECISQMVTFDLMGKIVNKYVKDEKSKIEEKKYKF